MSAKSILAVGSFAAFTALPFLAPSEGAAVQPLAPLAAPPGDQLGCYAPGGMGTISTLNPGKSPATVDFTFYGGGGGGGNITATVDLDAPGSATIPLPDGFQGSAVMSSDQPVVAILNNLGDGTADSSGSAYPCLPPFPFSGLVFPILTNQQIVYLFNLTTSPLEVTSYIYGQDGTQSTAPGVTMLPPGGVGMVNARDAGGKDLAKPGSLLPFAHGSEAIHAVTAFDPNGHTGPPDFYQGVGFDDAADGLFIFVPPTAGDPGFDGDLNVQSHFPGSNPYTATWHDPSGGVVTTTGGTIPGQGTAVVPVPGVGGKVLSGVNLVGSGVSGSISYTGLERLADGSFRAGGASGTWGAMTPADTISKRGYAFGAPSTKKSKVSVVVHNVGDSTAKVKIRIIDGDTGKKVQSGKANVKPNGTATVAFKKKARGNNLYAELTVKGKSSVVAGLLRVYKDDVDFYPAVAR